MIVWQVMTILTRKESKRFFSVLSGSIGCGEKLKGANSV